jgi:hypothetical protein
MWTSEIVTTSQSIGLSLCSRGISLRDVILRCLLDPEDEGTTILRNIEDSLPAHCETRQETSTCNSTAVRNSNLACPTELWLYNNMNLAPM